MVDSGSTHARRAWVVDSGSTRVSSLVTRHSSPKVALIALWRDTFPGSTASQADRPPREKRMKASLAITIVLMLASIPGAYAAQRQVAGGTESYPSRPIRVLVPQGPSGSNDIMARYVGGQPSERLGRQVVVDNRPGAEGMIATDIVAKAAPD